jgi:predicted enzyme related to lactoylglutathione lyase
VVPAIFLVEAKEGSGSIGLPIDNSARQPIACFITPRIREMYDRFIENGVNIVSEIPKKRPAGRNFRFCDPDGNMLEMWQP